MCVIDNIVIATVYDVISFSNDENIYSVDLYHYMYYYSRWLEKCNFQAIIFFTEPFFFAFFSYWEIIDGHRVFSENSSQCCP